MIWQRSLWKGWRTLVSALIVCVAAGLPAIAQDQETLLLLTDPLDLNLLEPGNTPTDGSVTTGSTISQTGLTIPSLWWVQDQFGGKLVNNWLAYSGSDGAPRRVDLVVNPQVWSLYTYLERYAFLTHFGNTAKDFGYNLRVFSREQELLGAYICNFDELNIQSPPSLPDVSTSSNRSEAAEQLQCDIFLDPFGPGALRGRTGSLDRFQPRGGGTVQP